MVGPRFDSVGLFGKLPDDELPRPNALRHGVSLRRFRRRVVLPAWRAEMDPAMAPPEHRVPNNYRMCKRCSIARSPDDISCRHFVEQGCLALGPTPEGSDFPHRARAAAVSELDARASISILSYGCARRPPPASAPPSTMAERHRQRALDVDKRTGCASRKPLAAGRAAREVGASAAA